jgi:nitric oxide reductase subunit B
MDHGSFWGHGSLRGMDFSATTLHLAGKAMQSFYSKQEYSRDFEELDTRQKENIKAIVKNESTRK